MPDYRIVYRVTTQADTLEEAREDADRLALALIADPDVVTVECRVNARGEQVSNYAANEGSNNNA